MKRGIALALASMLLFSLSTPCFADFQYTESTKITGGAAVGAMKFAGVFSKDARQATQGTTATISFKGNKMRREDSLGQVEIIDLDGRRITQIDSKKKTYSTMTFDEMRARMEEARKKAAEQQAKRNKEQASQVKIVPKVTITPGTGSKRLLDYNAKEMKMRVDMEMTSDDPGAMVGGNAQIAPAMIEFRKSATTLNGMPLFSMVSVGMAGQPGAQQQTSRDEQKQSGGNPLSN